MAKLLIDRDSFVTSLSHWLRWRGHTLSHDIFSQRFALPAGSHELDALQNCASELGLRVKLREGVVNVPQNSAGHDEFPAVALLKNGTCVLVRGKTQDGDWVVSHTAKFVRSRLNDDAPPISPGSTGQAEVLERVAQERTQPELITDKDVLGWIPVQLERRRLHEEMFGPARTPRAWIWATVRRQWGLYAQGAVAAAFINILAALAALYSLQIYDRVIPTNAQSTLWVLTIGVLGLYMFDFILRSLRSYLIDTASRRVDLKLSGQVFEQALGVRMEARPQHMGTFISQLREHESVREFLMSGVLFVISDLPFILVFLVMIYVIGGSLVLVPAIAIPVMILLSLLVQIPLAKLARANQREGSARSGLLIEAVEGAETLKTLNAEWRMSRRWQELSQLLSGTMLKTKNWSNLNNNLAYTLSQVVYVAVIVMGVYLTTKGDLTTGALVAVSILVGRCMQPVSGLVALLVRYHQARSSTETLDNIMGLPVDRPADQSFISLNKHAGQLQVQNLQFSYVANDMLAVDVPHILIQPGEKVAILGRTGSGKSTLLRLLSGLYLPTRGRVRLDGLDVSQIDPTRFRESVGYLTQDVRLFAGTLKENLLLGCGPVSDDKLMAAVKATGVDRMVQMHPQGLDMPIFEGGGGLSGGQRQAVGLARMMLCEPVVCLLDEPTASMDQQSETELIQRLDWVKNPAVTLVVVTHKPSMLQWANRVVVMEQGRVITDGPKESVLKLLQTGGIKLDAQGRPIDSTPPPGAHPVQRPMQRPVQRSLGGHVASGPNTAQGTGAPS